MQIEDLHTLAFLDFPADLACEKLLQYRGAGIDAYITANSCKPFMMGWYGGTRYDYREYAGEITKLVRREPATHDRRCTLAVLTPAGERLFEEVFPAHIGALKERLGKLTAGQRTAAIAALRDIRAVL